MNRNGLAPALLAFSIGLIGALLLAHWSACEQDDAVCAFTGRDAEEASPAGVEGTHEENEPQASGAWSGSTAVPIHFFAL